ncbi:MAG: CidA/LrgA family protein [Gammaproteobacteria bacterium]|nr:CidA/LrgA family protein [Gammaproteobacteria bacterium]
MLVGVIGLIAFQLAGEWLASYFKLPLPGSVCGMFLLLVFLLLRGGVSDSLLSASNKLFAFLPMLLIPITVGIYTWFPYLASSWFEIGGVLVVSFFITYFIAFFMMNKLSS